MMGRSRRGGVAIEFALVCPILLAFTVGALEWGRLLVAEVAMVTLVRDAALTGARAESLDDPAAVARARVAAALTEAGYDPADSTVTVATRTLSTGTVLDVSVRLEYSAGVPLVPVPDHVGATESARLEDQ